MNDNIELPRRRFIIGAVGAIPLQSGNVQLQSSPQASDLEFETAAHLLGPFDARPAPDDPFFERKIAYAYVYRATDDPRVSILTDEDDAWSTIPRDSVWQDSDGDGLLELAEYNGIDIGVARLGWAGLDSFTEEEGSFDISMSGTQTVQFDNTYRFASASVGANQGNGSASWYGWQRDADGNITGMDVSYDTGTFSSATVRWHVTGNQTEASYGGGA